MKISPVRATEVFLAIAYGAVVGSWLPVPRTAPIYALPAAVVTSPLPREPVPTEPPELHGAAPGVLRVLPAAWSPVDPLLPVTPSPRAPVSAARAWTADTLPAAPHIPVSPLATVGSDYGARQSEGLVIAAASGHPRRSASGCPAIVAEGEPVAPGCERRSPPRRSQGACPSAGRQAPGASIVCIRAED